MEDKLFCGLPAIALDKEKYIIFSPYNNKIIKVSKEDIDKERFKKYLEKKDYFGKTKEFNKEETAKLTLILTSDCNLRCKYCYASCGEKKKYMDEKFALRAIDEVIKPSTKKIIVSFFGGEPTLCFSLIKKVVSFVKNKNIESEFHLSTNAVFISDEMIDYFINNKFVLGISIDGPPKYHDKLRVFPDNKPTSHLVENTIKRLVARKAHFTVRPTITNLNVNAMPEMVDYFASLGTKFIHFELVDLYGRALFNELKLPDARDYINNFKKAIKKAQEKGIYILNSAIINLLSPTKYYCSACNGETFIFTSDGYVTSCYEIHEGNHEYQEFVTGKYNLKTASFNYDESKIKKLKEISVDSYEKCKNCFAKYICGSGCPLKNYRDNKSFNEINKYLCEIRKNIIREAIISIYEASLKGMIPVVFGINAYENY